MAHPFEKPSLFISSLLLALLSLAATSSSTNTPTLKHIFSKHKNPNPSWTSCFPHQLESHNASRRERAVLQLKKMGMCLLNRGRPKALEAQTLIQSLIKHSNDSTLKHHYSACSRYYKNVLIELNQSKHLLVKGDYMGFGKATFAVINNVVACNSQIPPSDPSDLKKNNGELEGLCGLNVNIATTLMMMSNN